MINQADETEGSLSNTESKIPMGIPMDPQDHPTYMLPPPTEGHDGTILGLTKPKPRTRRVR